MTQFGDMPSSLRSAIEHQAGPHYPLHISFARTTVRNHEETPMSFIRKIDPADLERLLVGRAQATVIRYTVNRRYDGYLSDLGLEVGAAGTIDMELNDVNTWGENRPTVVRRLKDAVSRRGWNLVVSTVNAQVYFVVEERQGGELLNVQLPELPMSAQQAEGEPEECAPGNRMEEPDKGKLERPKGSPLRGRKSQERALGNTRPLS